MKAIFISFNQAYYEMILSIMDRSNIRGFTFWETVQGRGSQKGEPHYGSHACLFHLLRPLSLRTVRISNRMVRISNVQLCLN